VLAGLVGLRDAADDLGVQRDRAGGERLVDLGHVASIMPSPGSFSFSIER
jgi:hypothetical protein